MKASKAKSTSALSALGRRIEEPPISWLMKQTLDHPHVISLAAGFTDNASLPVRETRMILRELLAEAEAGQAALQYGAAAGEPTLRRFTAQDLQIFDTDRSVRRHMPPYLPENTLITHGSQQLLYMVTEALCDEGDIVLVEDPTYFVYLGIAQSRAIECRGVPLLDDGLDLEALDRKLAALKRSGDLRRVKMLYLVTYLQNPTGITTRFEKKVAALELLRRYERHAGHPLYLVEDGAYRELRFAGRDERSALAAKGFGERVIYTSTYSKPFATGIRVGFGILPEPLFTRVLRIKGNHDFGTANLLQQILVRAIASSRYEMHLADLHVRYAAKAAVMKRAMREHFPDWVQWREPEGGLYYWARLPQRCKSGLKSKLFKTALAQDVLYVPGELCYADDPTRPKPNHEMRISFGGASLEDIAEGIAQLGRVLKAC